jgi:hypothetical protein
VSESVFLYAWKMTRWSAANTRKIPRSPLALEQTRVVRDGASHREAAVVVESAGLVQVSQIRQ